MIDTIVEMFSYPFMVRAFAVGSLVALCAALLGVSLAGKIQFVIFCFIYTNR